MLGHYLLTLYRTLSRHRLFAALNIFGLAVGLAVFLALTIAFRFEFSYDRWIPDAEHIYRVTGIMKMPGRPSERMAVVPGPVLPNLRANFGQIEDGVRLLTTQIAVRRGEHGAYEDVVFADPSFFGVFKLPLAAGDPGGALADTASLVISQRMAEKYFGKAPALGQRLTLDTDGVQRDYRISGVLKDLPENTHLKLDFLARLDRSVLPMEAMYLDDWSATNYITYVRLPNQAAADAMQAVFPAFLHGRPDSLETWLGLKLEPLPSLHFHTNDLADLKPGVDIRFVIMLQVVGVLTLLLAAINYVNLSTARAMLRAREVAVRKVLGGARVALIGQFLIEAVGLSLIAGLVALALLELLLPQINAALGTTLELRYLGPDGVLPMLAAFTVLVGLLAGAYPALVISGFRPSAVLAASRAPGGGRAASALREMLVIAQFAASIALMVCTAVVLAQADYVRRSDLGYRREGLILVKRLAGPDVWPRRMTLQDAFRRVPGVESLTLSDRFPGRGEVGRSDGFHRPGRDLKHGIQLSWELFNDGYLQTYGARMLAGRPLNAANGLDDRDGLDDDALAARGLNVLINQTAAKALYFAKPSDAVGQVIREGRTGPRVRIVGVVQDLRFGSPRDPVPPIIYSRNESPKAEPSGDPTIVVRYRGDPKAVMQDLRTAWRGVVPDVPFDAETAESALDSFYVPEERGSRLLTLGAGVAVLIGCLGLYGLAAFTSQRRTREIGIRKTLGASTADVLRLLVGQFLRPVLVANLIAWPAAYFAMRSWLSGFDQRVGLSSLYFLAATALALAIATVTVIGQTLKVARSEPAKALRYE